MRQRLAALRLGLGVDEIGETFDLGQVELAVLEGAPRELAGLGEPRAGKRQHRVDHLADHGAAAMHMKLGHVLAGEARRAGEPQHEPAVELRPSRRPESAQARMPRLGDAAAERLEHGARRGPETRITAMAARPAPLAGATMVSRCCATFIVASPVIALS